jgi:hypothetical protein
MDEGLRIAVEMTQSILDGLRKDLEGLTPEEVEWRRCPRRTTSP